MKIQTSAQSLLQRAAEAGIGDLQDLLSRTPREIEMEFHALERRRQREWENLDLLAWLAGRYFLIALHAPRRYPRRPDGVRRNASGMTADQMKQVFADMSAGREEEHGDCGKP